MIKNIKYKKGNVIVTAPIILLCCMFLILVLGTFYINAIKPFIWYEKLNNISNKYMFIIEKYGYLTNSEKNNLENDLLKAGFDIDKINIQCPESKKTYGELLEFHISYNLDNSFNVFNNTTLKDKLNNITLVVKKYSFSKYTL